MQKKRKKLASAQHRIVTHDPMFLERLLLLVALVSVLTLYPILNRPWGEVHSLATAIDAQIPLIPVFVVPYLFFFFPWAVALVGWSFLQRPQLFRRLICTLLIGFLLSYCVYIFFQTAVYRPRIIGGGVLDALLQMVYHADARYNAFPSTHTVVTTILLLTTWPLARTIGIRLVLLCVAVSIVLSTLFTHQHNIADVVFGLVLGVVSYALGCFFFCRKNMVPQKVIAPHDRPSKRR